MKEIMKKCEQQMQKRHDVLIGDYSAIRAGRANPAVLDKVFVDYYGSKTPIRELASVSVAEARVLVIQPWDTSVLDDIEKAINMSDIGLNPNNDGKVLRIVFPQLTEERRKEMVKEIHKMSEEAKVSIRNARRDAIDKLKLMKKNSEITEDELKIAEKDVQALTDTYCKNVEKTTAIKEKEIIEL